MIVNPNSIIERDDINLRQGIKSSLPKMKELFALVYTIFKTTNQSALIFSEEYIDETITKIRLKQDILVNILSFFSEQIKESDINEDSFVEIINQSPLLTSQLEALQVTLNLFWRIADITFVEEKASSAERTGGNRYNKKISFSTNIDIIDIALTYNTIDLEKETKDFLFKYLTSNTEYEVNNTEKRLIRLLTIFSEETQYKIRTSDSELYFQQEGIYKELAKGNTVNSNDIKEPVGPFRILKSAVKDNLNYFLKETKSNGFEISDISSIDELNKYQERVNTYLDLIPKRITYETLIEEVKEEVNINENSNYTQKIYYGAPGTGKSYKVDKIVKDLDEHYKERITFHPESDYASFVGGYKPISEYNEDKKEYEIQYKFVPQAFTEIYKRAWLEKDNKPYFLVIEEINRGNCAEIFGDIFQLLDRNSGYTVSPSNELKEYLESVLGEDHDGIKYGLKLPPNLSILATMNTSDQSLFPMDSAFKRRWDWEYIPINYEEKNTDDKENDSFKYVVKLDDNRTFKWIDFIKNVNDRIKINPSLGMDKCIGNYFIKPTELEISLDEFINKAIFYLWNDVFKDEEDNSIFVLKDKGKVTYEDFFPINDNAAELIEIILDEIDVKINTES